MRVIKAGILFLLFIIITSIIVDGFQNRDTQRISNNSTEKVGKKVTEFIEFDPGSIEPDQETPISGTCEPSINIPGTYICNMEGGGAGEPCFILEDDLLMCDPNPVFENYQSIVKASNELSETLTPTQNSPFYIQLEGNTPPCSINTAKDSKIADQEVTYNCDAPGMSIVGPLDNSEAFWTANYVIVGTSTGEITTPPTEAGIVTAWLP